MKHKKVLYVLSEHFAPNQNIGAVKFTKIVKFLLQKDEYEIYVLTRKNFPKKDEILEKDYKLIEELGGKIIVIDAGSRYYRKSKLERLVRKYSKKLFTPNQAKEYVRYNKMGMRKFAKNGMRLLESLDIPAPDYMISTYDDFGAHILGECIKDKYGDEVYWVADFRDQVAIFFQDKTTRGWADNYSRVISEKSDCVTVSAGMAENMVFAEGTQIENIHIGFDYEDAKRVKIIHGALTFCYSGSYYGNRTIKPLLRAINELIDEGKVIKEDVAFVYCGDYGEDIKEELVEYNLSDNYVDWGRVTHLQSMLILDSADILISSIWNYYDYQGAIGGKTFEYIGLDKPIIAIVKGDKPDSDIKRLIMESESGVCYEEVNDEEDYVVLKNKVLSYYNEKKMYGHLTHKNNYRNVEKYDLKNIANQYDRILKEGK